MVEGAPNRISEARNLPSKIWLGPLCWLLLCVSCVRNPGTRECLSPTFAPQVPDAVEEPYGLLREKWTVVLGSRRSAGRGGGLVLPLSQRGRGSGDRQSTFPITVHATLMDARVVAAGLRYYADLLDMSPDEAEAFRLRYYENHNLEEHILIEAMLQTDLAESYLNIERWIIFVEDNCGNQYESVRIVELEMNPRPEEIGRARPGDYGPEAALFFHRDVRQKSILLYFPRLDSSGNPIIHEGTKHLRIAFLLKESPFSRAEGTWRFN